MVKAKKGPKLKPNLPAGDSRKKAIEERAYYRWLARNGEHGQDVEDWLGAEKELMENIFDRDAEG